MYSNVSSASCNIIFPTGCNGVGVIVGVLDGEAVGVIDGVIVDDGVLVKVGVVDGVLVEEGVGVNKEVASRNPHDAIRNDKRRRMENFFIVNTPCGWLTRASPAGRVGSETLLNRAISGFSRRVLPGRSAPSGASRVVRLYRFKNHTA